MASDLHDTYMADLRAMIRRAPRSLNSSGVQSVHNFKAQLARAHKVLGAAKPSLEAVTAARNGLATFYAADELRPRGAA